MEEAAVDGSDSRDIEEHEAIVVGACLLYTSPDREQRDQLVGVAADRDEQCRREPGQHHDAVREHLAVAAQSEQVGQVVVPREQAGQYLSLIHI